jgi:hypothetical protein
MSEELERRLLNDKALHSALKHIDKLMLLEATEDLIAAARCIRELRKKYADPQTNLVNLSQLSAVDLLVLEYVVGSVRRVAIRVLRHLDESGLSGAYHIHHKLVQEIAAKRAEEIVAEHSTLDIFENILSTEEQTRLVADVKEKRGEWLISSASNSEQTASFFFARIKELILGIRNHWLLRPTAIGVGFISYNIAVASSELWDGDLRLDKIILVAKELPSLPLGFAAIAAPFRRKKNPHG